MKLRHRLGGLVAVATLVTLGLTAAPAQAWTNAGTYDLSGTLASTLELGLGGSNPQLSCDLDFEATLNSGTGNTGTVNSVSPDPATCTTTVPNCDVTVSFDNLPWSLSGVNTGGGDGTVTISDATFDVDYSGGSCALNGTALTVEGDVTGDYDAGTGELVFTNASGLEVTASNNGLVPVTTAVTLNGTETVQGGTVPALQ